MHYCRFMFVTLCSCLPIMMLDAPAFAERAPLSPEKLKQEATHIVEGKVLGTYSRVDESMLYGAGTLVTRYVVEIEVGLVEDGEGIKPGDIIYVRAWTLKKRGAAGLTPGPSGHFTIPEEGDQIRAYAVKGKYGATGQDDRGMTAVYPNGFLMLDKEENAGE
jgi:hypothetical protein